MIDWINSAPKKMIQVIIYLDDNQSKNETQWLPADYTREQINEFINKAYDKWYSWDYQ